MVKKKQSFEESIKALEDIVREMESGQLSLEAAVEKFETGMKYSKQCLEILDKTEKIITRLRMDDAGHITEEPLDNE